MRSKTGNKEVKILNAAIKVFAKDGFHKAKISKIAEIADVAIGSIYLYYANKEELLNKIFEQVWDRLFLQADEYSKLEISPIEKFDNLIDQFFSLFDENPDLALVFVKEHNQLNEQGENIYSKYYDKFLLKGEEIVAEGIQKGVFKEGIDLHLFRNFAFGGIRHLLHLWAKDTSLPLIHVRTNLKDFLKKGIIA